MTQYSVLTLGFTAAAVMAAMMLIFAVLRLSSAAKGARRRLRESGSDTAFLSMALQDAVAKLKAQEHAMSVRAIASEQLNGQILESLAAGLLVVDRAGRVETLNPAGHRLLGAPGDVIGRDYLEFLGDAPELKALIERCLETGAAVANRRIQIDRGGVTHLSVTVSPLAAGEGWAGAICLFSDLTPVYELEEQLRLKEALARVGELTAGIAHEFRNGLATIHGYSRLIRPDELPPVYRPYVDGIRQETEALGHIVTNFLKFARPEQVVSAAVELEPLIRRAADELAHELPADTSIEVHGAFGIVDGDEVLLRQVFGNLIRNAAEACQTAGLAPRIDVFGQMDARSCRISLDDNGPGVPAQARAKIFQPFFTTRSRGTGLGLAIVQKLVVTHNGRVTVGTSPLGGASFQLTFPLRAGDAETLTAEAVEVG